MDHKKTPMFPAEDAVSTLAAWANKETGHRPLLTPSASGWTTPAVLWLCAFACALGVGLTRLAYTL